MTAPDRPAGPDAPGAAPTAVAWLKGQLRPVLPDLGQLGLVVLFVNTVGLAVPIFTLQVYDRVIAHAGLTTLQGLVAGVLLALLFDMVLRESRAAVLRRVALRLDVRLSQKLFGKLLALPLRTLEERHTGAWIQLFRDVDMLRNAVAGPMATLTLDLPFAILFLAAVFVIAPPVGWVLLAVLPVFVLLGWLSGMALRRAVGREQQAALGRDGLIVEAMGGRTTVKALALDPAVEAIWQDRQAGAIDAAHERGRVTDRFAAWGAGMAALTTVLVVSFGALAVLEQTMTMGALVAANMLAGRIVGPFTQLVAQWQAAMQTKASVQRLAALFALPEERTESGIARERPQGRLTLEKVSYAYAPTAKPVLDGLHVEIRPGGMTGIAGGNGSGKTTVLKLLRGLYAPTAGRVLLDGADIAQFTRAELAGWIGYVPQETVLFGATLRDAIAGGRIDASDADILAAARRAGVDAFASDLPDGYATQLGEGGHRLSGGQRQRIALARALLGDPPVLLLDEPSANLDHAAELTLRDLLVSLARTRTVIVATHSPMLLSACGSLMVLEGGRIVMGGAAKDVLPTLLGRGSSGPVPPIRPVATSG